MYNSNVSDVRSKVCKHSKVFWLFVHSKNCPGRALLHKKYVTPKQEGRGGSEYRMGGGERR
jgi:hypothetical protein